MADVFISYARTDRDRADRLRHLLEAAGLSVFMDVEGLDGGDTFPDVLDRELKTAGAVVGLWTPYSLTRPWVRTECLIGKDRNVLVPIILDPVGSMDMPAAFYSVHTIDLSDPYFDGDSEGYQHLLRSLSRTLNRPELWRRYARSHTEIPAQPTSEPAPPLPAEPPTQQNQPVYSQPDRETASEPGLGPLAIIGVLILALGSLFTCFGEVGDISVGFVPAALMALSAFFVGQFTPPGKLALRITLTIFALIGGFCHFEVMEGISLFGFGAAFSLGSVAMLYRHSLVPGLQHNGLIFGAVGIVLIILSCLINTQSLLTDRFSIGPSAESVFDLGIVLLVLVSPLRFRWTLLILLGVIGSLWLGELVTERIRYDTLQIGLPTLVVGALTASLVHFLAREQGRRLPASLQLSVLGVGWAFYTVSEMIPVLLPRLLAGLEPAAYAQAQPDDVVVVTGVYAGYSYMSFWLAAPLMGALAGYLLKVPGIALTVVAALIAAIAHTWGSGDWTGILFMDEYIGALLAACAGSFMASRQTTSR